MVHRTFASTAQESCSSSRQVWIKRVQRWQNAVHEHLNARSVLCPMEPIFQGRVNRAATGVSEDDEQGRP